MRAVGKSLTRVDGVDRVTGRALYAADSLPAHTLHAAFVRSPLAHARITGIDAEEARRMPGVVAVITGQDVPFHFGSMIQDQPVLAIGETRFVGEAVVAVAAETALQAQMAADAIKVNYEELAAVFDAEEALKPNTPLVHLNPSSYKRGKKYQAHDGSNICHLHEVSSGDTESALAAADHVFEGTYSIQAVSPSPLEPHTSVAVKNPVTGELTIWTSTDSPHRRVSELAATFGVGLEKVRVIAMAMGGGFGGKGTPLTETLAVALAAHTGGRPVRVLLSREEVLSATVTRVPAKIRLKVGVMNDGTITACMADMIWNNGAYASKAPEVASRGGMTVVGPYNIPNVTLRSVLVYTHMQPSGSFRGYGTTQTAFACEAHMDFMAKELGLDPLQFRLKNAYREGDEHFSGQKMRGVGLVETLEKAAECVGLGQPPRSPDGTKRYGKGIACMLKGTNTPTISSCTVRLSQDGSLRVLSSSVDVGAGQTTVITQFASEASGVTPDRIRVSQPDTALTPYDFGCTSSRNTFHMGNAVILACKDMQRSLFGAAEKRFGLPASGFRVENNRLLHQGLDMPLAEAIKSIFPKGGDFIGLGTYSPEGSSLLEGRHAHSKTDGSIFWLFVTHAAEVEVDVKTGKVRVLHVAAAHDVGRAINPLNCRQQIEGSVVMGSSLTFLEEFKVEKGRICNDSLLDYKIASFEDIPERIDSILVESAHPEAPFGAKGVGEPAAAATAPAIANAIYDACGVRLTELPFTPEKVLNALRQKENTA